MSDQIAITRSDGWAEVRLNRPEALNAIDPAMLRSLLDALTTLSAERELRAVVLSAEGRVFSAGVDVGTVFFMERGGAEAVPVPEAWESPFYGVDLLEWQHQ